MPLTPQPPRTPLLTEPVRQAIDRLLAAASSEQVTFTNTACANFLLAWWNARDYGGFDLTELWGLDDDSLREAMLITFAFIGLQASFPNELNDVHYQHAFDALVRRWRPSSPVQRGSRDRTDRNSRR